MGHIIPKSNLNRNPELVDNYGLVCAKNIRLLDDGTIGPDTAEVSIEIQEKLNELLNEDETSKEYKIVGVIPYNTCFYLFVIYQYTKDDVLQTQSYIVKYDVKSMLSETISLLSYNNLPSLLTENLLRTSLLVWVCN